MDENRLKFGVGVLVISAIGIGIILTFLFGAFPSVLNRDYTLSVVFPSAEGIGANSPVVRDGVRIGRVSDIKLRDEGGVLVTLAMDSYQDADATISSPASAAGISSPAIRHWSSSQQVRPNWIQSSRTIARSSRRRTAMANSWTTAPSRKALFEMQNDLKQTFDAIRRAGDSIVLAGDSVNQLAMEVRDVVGGADSKVDELAEEAVKTLEEFQGAIRDVRAITGNPELRNNLERSLAELPEVLADAKAAFDSTHKTFEKFEQVGNSSRGLASPPRILSEARKRQLRVLNKPSATWNSSPNRWPSVATNLWHRQ